MKDRAKNFIKRALPVSLSEASQFFKDALGGEDLDDLYGFKLGDRSSFEMLVTDIKKGANIDVQLYALKGEKQSVLKKIGKIVFSDLTRKDIKRHLTLVGQSKGKGNRDEILNLTLNAGEYLLRLYSRTEISPYELALSATTLTPPTPIPVPVPTPVPPSPTPTPIPTPIPTPTPTPTPTPIPTPTPTPTPIPTPTPTPTPLTAAWIRQLGSTLVSGLPNDYAYDVAIDTLGNAYVVGLTAGALPGNTSLGDDDALLSKYDSSGVLQWIRQVGSDRIDSFSGVETDSLGNVYAAGIVDGSAPAIAGLSVTSGSGDAYLVKYDSNGNLLWSKTYDSGGIDVAFGMAIDATNTTYMAGVSVAISGSIFPSISFKSFVTKYDSAGNGQTLTGDISNVTTSGAITGIEVDSAGNLYVTGITNAQADLTNLASPDFDLSKLDEYLVGEDTFVAKYNSSGQELWYTELAGTGESYARGIALDSLGNPYIVGQTTGILVSGTTSPNTNAGGVDAFVAKLSGSTGATQWVNQFGTSQSDQAQGIALSPLDQIYITGDTYPATGESKSEAFLSKYNTDGALLFQQLIGTAQDDEAYGITTSASHVYLAGQTFGALDGSTHQGDYDVWLAKYIL